jgi:iron complex transport system permease protein
MLGAFVVSASFVVSKIVIPGVILPIGLVTAMIGVPVFLLIIFRKMRTL